MKCCNYCAAAPAGASKPKVAIDRNNVLQHPRRGTNKVAGNKKNKKLSYYPTIFLTYCTVPCPPFRPMLPHVALGTNRMRERRRAAQSPRRLSVCRGMGMKERKQSQGASRVKVYSSPAAQSRKSSKNASKGLAVSCSPCAGISVPWCSGGL